VPPEPLHVLMLEDSPVDADLVLHELRRGGYEPIARRVDSREEMVKALDDGSWQIVLLDYTLEGGGTALNTLAALTELGLDVPAILISGVIGEEEAADALRAGARDFVNKGNLTRLVPAVGRELEQVEARRQQREGVQALKESEQRLRLALAAGDMASWEWDLSSDHLYWSEALEGMFGLQPFAFGGTYAEFIERVHPDDRERVGASVEEAVAHDSPAVVYRAVWPDATVHWHERKSQRFLDADGRCERMAGITFDVTEREEAAQVLRESEARFRMIAEHAHDLIALLDAQGCYRYVSPSFESLLGYSHGRLLGRAASELIHADDWVEGSWWGAGKLIGMRMRKADGSWLWVERLSYEIVGPGETQYALIARDISERKLAEAAKEQLEAELRQTQKMEAVGLLAGGIAHDFNNLLTVISGYTEILLRRLGREGEGSKEIAQISKAAGQAGRLTRQLLAYSRKQVLEVMPLDLNDVVTRTHVMLSRVIGENIEFSTILGDNLGSICADDGQIEQIVMNLAVNARDAMPEGGRLVLATTNVTVTDVFPDSGPDEPGD